MPERRHRINEAETEQIFRGLILRLGELLESEEDQESAEVVLNFLRRLFGGKSGRPKSLEFSWDLVQVIHELYKDKTWKDLEKKIVW